ncbi:MAG: GrpB family protein [Patescibacteria group bacterium]|nr:GrpB family protein [Patescibacteria group bacterium]
MRDEYKNRKYDIRHYDPAWAAEFGLLAGDLKDVFGADAVAIEHVGSTAVPGMSGKPTLDVLVLVEDLSAAGRHERQMSEAGYERLDEYVSPGSMLFRRMEGGEVLENVHAFRKDHPHVREMIALRDYLRSHPEEIRAYSGLKEKLFREHPGDYTAYRKAKDAYVKELQTRAEGAMGRG